MTKFPFNHNRTESVDCLTINYVNSLFDELFMHVHKHLYEEHLPANVLQQCRSNLERISDVVYKSDNIATKHETLSLITRRSYLLVELVNNKSSIRDCQFNCELYELYWFVSELLEIFENQMDEYYY